MLCLSSRRRAARSPRHAAPAVVDAPPGSRRKCARVEDLLGCAPRRRRSRFAGLLPSVVFCGEPGRKRLAGGRSRSRQGRPPDKAGARRDNGPMTDGQQARTALEEIGGEEKVRAVVQRFHHLMAAQCGAAGRLPCSSTRAAAWSATASANSRRPRCRSGRGRCASLAKDSRAAAGARFQRSSSRGMCATAPP